MSGRTRRIAWVTGGASGIGQAGAEALAADGWTVVISGRRPDALAATAERVRTSGGVVDVFPLDVTNPTRSPLSPTLFSQSMDESIFSLTVPA